MMVELLLKLIAEKGRIKKNKYISMSWVPSELLFASITLENKAESYSRANIGRRRVKKKRKNRGIEGFGVDRELILE